MNSSEFQNAIDVTASRVFGKIDASLADVEEHAIAFPVHGYTVPFHYEVKDSSGKVWRVMPMDGGVYLRPRFLAPADE